MICSRVLQGALDMSALHFVSIVSWQTFYVSKCLPFDTVHLAAYCTARFCLHEDMGLNFWRLKRWERVYVGRCWKVILFTVQCTLQYSISLLGYRGSSSLQHLIDNMLDGEPWLFPNRQKTEGDISTSISCGLHSLPISSKPVQMSLVDTVFQQRQLCKCWL